MRPVYGSAVVLNAYATRSPPGSGATSTASPSPSSAEIAPRISGDGRSSTSASRSRLVPRFRVAIPQVTGKRCPSVTPFLSAETISAWEILALEIPLHELV